MESDQYWLRTAIKPDFSKGEELLLKALNVFNLADRDAVERRLQLMRKTPIHLGEGFYALARNNRQEEAAYGVALFSLVARIN